VKFLIGGWDQGVARLWNAKTGKLTYSLIHTPPAERDPQFLTHIYGLVFSPDSRYVLIRTINNATLWNVRTGTKIRTFSDVEEYPGETTNALFSPNGSYVLTTSVRGGILWEVATGKQVMKFPEPRTGRNFFQFSADDKYILAGNGEHGYAWDLWDIKTDQIVHTFAIEGTTIATFSPDGRKVLTGTASGDLTLWQLDPVTSLFTVHENGYFWENAEFSPDGRFLLTYTEDDARSQILVLWNAQQGTKLHTFKFRWPGNPPVAYGFFLPDGKRLIVTGGLESSPPIYQMWSTDPIQKIREYSIPEEGTTYPILGREFVAISPDNKSIYADFGVEVLARVDIETGKILQYFC
jgi:WD40 repeat protein